MPASLQKGGRYRCRGTMVPGNKVTIRLTLLERRLRIITRITLSVYIIIHLCNHAPGLISLEAMEAMRKLATPFWRSMPGGILIFGSLLAGHVADDRVLDIDLRPLYS